MSDIIQRWRHGNEPDGCSGMWEDDSGEWVKYDEIERLFAELAEANRLLAEPNYCAKCGCNPETSKALTGGYSIEQMFTALEACDRDTIERFTEALRRTASKASLGKDAP